ncbi:MAG: hypothetical protein CL818_09360 [Croceibacter sp.]|jgi:hypothetical protein|uniref:Uncharacterized protein n=1 Tax=Croceibacter atlanticus (strain ATCC BAA-628 / JCM 21780 / CIP 108009 / IAM 15332 / KCTC 12090 / HTCC2559) TaxID=216432 RepID=A3U9U0_CROAH|nr:hypothetical protein CA2559_11088 [Croceibacter atlanticus HTCC2559]MAM22167.1 hypothetical protein [Croceibacter sp.]MBG26266.1 hypothetical protein [Croceibacter sp.]HAT69040.1 hypothetical protein [Flavobacteriaceae bacterium]
MKAHNESMCRTFVCKAIYAIFVKSGLLFEASKLHIIFRVQIFILNVIYTNTNELCVIKL